MIVDEWLSHSEQDYSVHLQQNNPRHLCQGQGNSWHIRQPATKHYKNLQQTITQIYSKPLRISQLEAYVAI